MWPIAVFLLRYHSNLKIFGFGLSYLNLSIWGLGNCNGHFSLKTKWKQKKRHINRSWKESSVAALKRRVIVLSVVLNLYIIQCTACYWKIQYFNFCSNKPTFETLIITTPTVTISSQFPVVLCVEIVCDYAFKFNIFSQSHKQRILKVSVDSSVPFI